MATESTVNIQYKTDKASVNQTLSAQKKIAKGSQVVDKSVRSIGKGAVGLGGRFKEGVAPVKQLTKEVKSAEKATNKLADAAQRANDRFDETSKSVALAGDVESNLRAVGGAASAAGLGGVGTGIGVVAEVPALVEALPKLKSAATGLPSTIASMASSLGPVGVAAGAAAVGIGVMLKAILDVQSAATKEAETIFAGQTAAFDAIAQGPEAVAALTESVNQSIAARKLEKEALLEMKAAGEEAVSGFNLIESGLLTIGELAGKTPMEALNDRIAENSREAQQGQKTLDKLAEHMGDVSASAEKAAGSEQALAQSRNAQTDSSKQVEQQDRKAEQQREKMIRAAEQSAKQMANARRKYSDSIKKIGTDTSNAISDARKKNKQAIKDLETSLSDDFTEIFIKSNEERFKINQDANREGLQSTREFQKSIKDIRKEGARAELDALRNRDFLALAETREAKQQELDDTKDAAQDAKKERAIALKDALQDQKRDTAIQRMDRQRSQAIQRRDLQIDQSRQLRDIYTNRQRQLRAAADARNRELKIAQEGAQAGLKITKQFWEGVLKQGSSAINAMNGSGRTSSRRSSQINGTSVSTLSGGVSSLNGMSSLGIFG